MVLDLQNKSQIKLAHHWTVVSCSIEISFYIENLVSAVFGMKRPLARVLRQSSASDAPAQLRLNLLGQISSHLKQLIISLQAKCKKSTAVNTKPRKQT